MLPLFKGSIVNENLTILCQVIFGLGLPFASHSSVIVEPFRTTRFPSDGIELMEGGTKRNKRNKNHICITFGIVDIFLLINSKSKIITENLCCLRVCCSVFTIRGQ